MVLIPQCEWQKNTQLTSPFLEFVVNLVSAQAYWLSSVLDLLVVALIPVATKAELSMFRNARHYVLTIQRRFHSRRGLRPNFHETHCLLVFTKRLTKSYRLYPPRPLHCL